MEKMINFIDEYKDDDGVGPICKLLPIAPSTYYARHAVINNPEIGSNRSKQDACDSKDIERVWRDNHRVYGSRKIWHALRREGLDIARCRAMVEFG